MSGPDLLDEHGDFPVPLDDDLGSRAYVAPPPRARARTACSTGTTRT